mgnify:FL=1|tara:strand:+ start:136 stop:648 length:513 start_codon:yes stop_codon:yes gene_type:complete
MLETYTISKIDVLEGKSEINLEGLSKLILELESEKSFDLAGDTSKCPESPIINQIINEMTDSFYKTTGLTIELCKKWCHVHHKNMSTNMHDHYPDDISSVFYVSTPKGSGNIVFYPNWFTHQRYSRGDTSSFTPEVGKFLIFPGTLDHAVMRNHSDEPRISLVFNFNILN